MNVLKNLLRSEEGITAGCVDKYFVHSVATSKYQEKSLDALVCNKYFSVKKRVK